MQKVIKGLRHIGVILLIIIASIGMGISGVVLPLSRERYVDVEIKIEQVDKREDDELEKDEVKT